MSDKNENKEAVVSENDRIAQLEGQVKQLLELLALQNTNKEQKSSHTSTGDTIKIVHLVERGEGLKTIMRLGNGTEIAMTKFGEERTLTVPQFEEILGNYRGWFRDGILAVHQDYEEKARFYSLDTAATYPVNSEFMRGLSTKTMSEIEDIFPRLPKAGKESLCSYWMRKALAGDPHFADIRNLETMNRLTDGAFETVITAQKQKRNNKK